MWLATTGRVRSCDANAARIPNRSATGCPDILGGARLASTSAHSGRTLADTGPGMAQACSVAVGMAADKDVGTAALAHVRAFAARAQFCPARLGADRARAGSDSNHRDTPRHTRNRTGSRHSKGLSRIHPPVNRKGHWR